MKFLLLHSHFRWKNGATNYIQRLARELEAQGHSVSILLEEPSSYSKLYWLRFGHYLEKTRQRIQRHLILSAGAPYDAIVASMFPLTVLLPMLAVPEKTKRFVFCFEPHVYFHDQEIIQGLPLHVRILMANIKRKYGRQEMEAHHQVDGILTYSDMVGPYVQNVYGRDARSIGMGVNPQPELSRVHCGFILHSTDGSPLKHTEMLIESIPVFKEKFPDIEVRILNNQVNPLSRKRYLEVCKGATLGVYMGTGGAGVQSLFLLELMSFGKCVVRGDNSPEVQDGVTGRTFKSGDIKDFQRVTLELLGDKEQRERLGRAAREHVREKYCWPGVVTKLIEEIS